MCRKTRWRQCTFCCPNVILVLIFLIKRRAVKKYEGCRFLMKGLKDLHYWTQPHVGIAIFRPQPPGSPVIWLVEAVTNKRAPASSGGNFREEVYFPWFTYGARMQTIVKNCLHFFSFNLFCCFAFLSFCCCFVFLSFVSFLLLSFFSFCLFVLSQNPTAWTLLVFRIQLSSFVFLSKIYEMRIRKYICLDKYKYTKSMIMKIAH